MTDDGDDEDEYGGFDVKMPVKSVPRSFYFQHIAVPMTDDEDEDEYGGFDDRVPVKSVPR
jgi:hypothetical protein